MRLFAVLSALAWAGLIVVSWQAIAAMGAGAAGDVFFADLAHPWRAQFNLDFLGHLVLMATWIFLRTPNKILGFAMGILAVVGGGAFTFAYIAIAIIRSDGDLGRFLLGPRRATLANG